QDAALARAVSEGRKREFSERGEVPEHVPDPQSPATFEASKLDWTELESPEHRRLFDWYRAHVQLRKREPALQGGHFPDVQLDADGRGLRIQRGPVLVLANLSAAPRTVSVEQGAELLLGSEGVGLGESELSLPAWGVTILRVGILHT